MRAASALRKLKKDIGYSTLLEIIRTYGKDKFGEGLYNDAAYAKKYDE